MKKHKFAIMIRMTYYIYGVLSLLMGLVPYRLYGQKLNLIPQAQAVVENGKGTLSVSRLKSICFPEVWEQQGRLLTCEVNQAVGLFLKHSSAHASIRITQSDKQASEAYTLVVSKQGISIEAGDVGGLNHALATFSQLVLHATDGKLPLLTIQDKPRMEYRGLMIDCSRHFWTAEQLKRCIRQMAFFKLNTLHLHLTDNQGWRFYFHKHPELTAKGTYYQAVKELSGQYYTYAELKDLVAYAAVHGVEIIPEIDLPGHCQALLAAIPRLSCNGGAFEVYPEEDETSVRTRRGENMLCVGNPETYRFVDELVTELAEIFPSKYIHLGGDEVSTHIWKKCSKCQDLHKRKGMKSWHELQDYFTRNVSRLVRAKGKTMIGWDEINDRNAAEREDVIMVWQRDGKEQQQKAMERGLQVIMSPKDPFYFDFGYSRNSTRRVYEWDFDNANPLIKGAQANVWTEFIPTGIDLEEMLFPRACALAETLWNTSDKKDWPDFRKRVEKYYSVFDRWGMGYYVDADMDSPGFVPQTDARPRLVCPAHIETNIEGIKYYHPEYAFDGDERTFFATPYSLDKGSYFAVVLDKPKQVQSIRVVFDASREHPANINLMVSTDGQQFETVTARITNGVLQASFDVPQIVKSVKIELTTSLLARLSIKEFILH